MNLNDEGPWGPPKKKSEKKSPQNPWSGNHQGGNHGGPSGSHEVPPPDFEKIFRQMKKDFGPFKPKSPIHVGLIAFIVLVGLWLLSGFYMVDANQLGVVMRFGAFDRTEMPGLRYHMPAPIERVLLPVVTSQNEIQIGFRRFGERADQMRAVPEESQMLTGDENLVNVEYTVFWRIGDVSQYLFEIRRPQTTIKMAAESVMREVIGQNKLQFALTEGRSQIAEDARKRLQALMDEYKAGIIVTQINLQEIAVPEEVKDAFQDVVNARLDMERFQNQAAAHVNKVIPEAKGEAAKLTQGAMAYRDQKIAIAKGEAARFEEVLEAYRTAKDVTSKRLYLETIEQVLGNAKKVITSSNAGTVPLYPLHDLQKQKVKRGDDVQ